MVLLTENHTELLFMLLLYLSSGPFVALFLSLNLSFVGDAIGTAFLFEVLRDGCRNQNGRIFGKAIDPPSPSFLVDHVANFYQFHVQKALFKGPRSAS